MAGRTGGGQSGVSGRAGDPGRAGTGHPAELAPTRTGPGPRRRRLAHGVAEPSQSTQPAGRGAGTGRALSFLMIDLDDFGLVNNTYGHPAGDAAIIAVAGALRAHARAIDILGRYGGDEFALILPDTALEEAVEVADRIRAAIAAVQVVASPAAIRVSASIGVAASPLHGRARADLVHAA